MLKQQYSTQLNAEFRVMERDTSAENDEFCRVQMQEFAIQAEEAIDVQRQLYSLTFLAGAQKRLIRTLSLLSSPVGTTLSFGTLLDRSQK